MAKLIVNPTSSSRREIALARQLVSIGRDPSNDVVLPDAMVSRRHAVIEFRGSQYFIRDCNSSNGSLVNGDRVSERNLRDGDLVAIGTARMLFKEELEAEDVAGKVVQHPSAPRLHCPRCQADYRKGDLFCRQCGTSVAPPAPSKAVCASCGTVVPLPAKFCNACGEVLPGESASDPAPAPAPVAPPAAAEREPHRDDTPDARPTTPPPGSAAAPAAPPAAPAAAPAVRDERPPAPLLAARTPEPPSASVAHPSSRGIAASAVALAPPFPPRAESAPRPAARLTPATPRAASGPAPVSKPSTVSMAGVSGMDAPFAPRLVAGLVDAAIVGTVQALLLWPVLGYWWSRDLRGEIPFLPIFLSLLAVPLILAIGGAYYAWFWGKKGATPGKKMLRLAVATADGTVPIGLQKATLRVLGYAASALLLGVGFLMMAFGGTALHDRMAGTRVVYRGRG